MTFAVVCAILCDSPPAPCPQAATVLYLRGHGERACVLRLGAFVADRKEVCVSMLLNPYYCERGKALVRSVSENTAPFAVDAHSKVGTTRIPSIDWC